VSGWLRNWHWELMLVGLILLAGAWASMLSPFYLSPDQILFSLQQSIAVVGILAAGMMVIVIVGEIDISLPAILTIGNILFARMSEAGVPLSIALPAVLLVGVAAGILNGVLVVGFALPSLAVTLGTMGAFRAIALLFGGNEGYAGFHEAYVWLGSAAWFDFLVPVSLVLVVVIFAAFAFLMHGTVFGRLAYLSGANAEATRFSGVRVARVKIAAFAIGGAMAGIASLVYIGQYQSARADNATDILLLIVTAVTLGGVDIFGGRGRVIGVLLALVLLGTLRNGMGLANFPGPVQTLAIGLLLIVSVLASQSSHAMRALLRATKSRRLATEAAGTSSRED
jgi:rhamnose transport system permease protein